MRPVGHRRAIAGPELLRRRLAGVAPLGVTPPCAGTAGIDPRQALAELRRLGARKSFLTDSPDVYLEPKSLHRFFTERIYRKLQGNAYFGYDYDEGFLLDGNQVQIEVLKDLSRGRLLPERLPRLPWSKPSRLRAWSSSPEHPTRLASRSSASSGKRPRTPCPGVMVEAYLRNSVLKKSFFIRYGAGHPRGLAAAIRLSAEMLAAQIISQSGHQSALRPRCRRIQCLR